MSIITRSAMLQMRVTPAIKHASEHVLRRMGLNMTEAVELFLRHLVKEEKLPFEVAALDTAMFTTILLDWEAEEARTRSTWKARHAVRRRPPPRKA